MQWFDFSLPIGWNELSAIATAIAVIIAVFANLNSNKQLKKELQMHCQTKELTLLEQRIRLLQKIEQDKKISLTEFNLFFNAKFNRKIWEAMQEYHESQEELSYCAAKEEIFWISFECDIVKGEKSPKTKKELLALKDKLLHIADTGYRYTELEDDLKRLSDKNKVNNPLQNTKVGELINYYDIYFHILCAKSKYNENKKILFQLMENVIEGSLETIS